MIFIYAIECPERSDCALMEPGWSGIEMMSKVVQTCHNNIMILQNENIYVQKLHKKWTNFQIKAENIRNDCFTQLCRLIPVFVHEQEREIL
jgi:hypothetical protein